MSIDNTPERVTHVDAALVHAVYIGLPHLVTEIQHRQLGDLAEKLARIADAGAASNG